MTGNQGTESDRNVTHLREHQRTFVGFVRFLAWLFGLTIAAIVFAALVNA